MSIPQLIPTGSITRPSGDPSFTYNSKKGIVAGAIQQFTTSGKRAFHVTTWDCRLLLHEYSEEMPNGRSRTHQTLDFPSLSAALEALTWDVSSVNREKEAKARKPHDERYSHREEEE